jgi:hypothetical protein
MHAVRARDREPRAARGLLRAARAIGRQVGSRRTPGARHGAGVWHIPSIKRALGRVSRHCIGIGIAH